MPTHATTSFKPAHLQYHDFIIQLYRLEYLTIMNCFIADAEAPDVFLGHAYNYTEERYLRILDKDDFSLIVGGRYEHKCLTLA